MENNKNGKNSGGLYGVVFCVLAITLTIGINLLASQLPVDKTKLDMTEIGLHTLSDNTKETAYSLEEDVYIYLICQSGNEDPTLVDMLQRYSELTPLIHVSSIDPAAYPNFTSEYTDQDLDNNSLIVSSEKRSQVIDYSNIATYTTFSGEDYITSALQYVTTDSLPVVYSIEGHGEKTIDNNLLNAFNKGGTELRTLNLLVSPEIPEDADAIFIYSPSSDLTPSEAQTIINYLVSGGRLILVTDYDVSNLENLSLVMENYGVSAVDGIVMESQSDMSLSGYPHYILPQLNNLNDITKTLNANNTYVLMPMSQAIEENPSHRDTIKVTSLLTTSSGSYIVNDSSYQPAEGTSFGPFTVAALIEEEYDNTETKILWVTNSYFLDSDNDNRVGGGNTQFLINSINYLCDREISAINSKNIALGTLTVTTSQSRMWKIILIGIIPAAVAAFGAVVWYRRKNR